MCKILHVSTCNFSGQSKTGEFTWFLQSQVLQQQNLNLHDVLMTDYYYYYNFPIAALHFHFRLFKLFFFSLWPSFNARFRCCFFSLSFRLDTVLFSFLNRANTSNCYCKETCLTIDTRAQIFFMFTSNRYILWNNLRLHFFFIMRSFFSQFSTEKKSEWVSECDGGRNKSLSHFLCAMFNWKITTV